MNQESKAVMDYDIIRREPFESLCDELAYASYRHNRRLAPGVSPERWAKIFQGAETLEMRYQQEIATANLDAHLQWRAGCYDDFDA
jgi:hypothetical protein